MIQEKEYGKGGGRDARSGALGRESEQSCCSYRSSSEIEAWRTKPVSTKEVHVGKIKTNKRFQGGVEEWDTVSRTVPPPLTEDHMHLSAVMGLSLSPILTKFVSSTPSHSTTSSRSVTFFLRRNSEISSQAKESKGAEKKRQRIQKEQRGRRRARRE